MYAITSTSWRAISRPQDLRPGETFAEEVPPALLRHAKAVEVRAERSRRLRGSDWTHIADAPISAAQRAQWAAYRQALRDLPSAPGFPDAITWPQEPVLPDGAASVPIR